MILQISGGLYKHEETTKAEVCVCVWTCVCVRGLCVCAYVCNCAQITLNIACNLCVRMPVIALDWRILNCMHGIRFDILTDNPTQDQVAEALLSGIFAGYEGFRCDPQVAGGQVHFNFAYDDNVFDQAYNRLIHPRG